MNSPNPNQFEAQVERKQQVLLHTWVLLRMWVQPRRLVQLHRLAQLRKLAQPRKLVQLNMLEQPSTSQVLPSKWQGRRTSPEQQQVACTWQVLQRTLLVQELHTMFEPEAEHIAAAPAAHTEVQQNT